MAIGDRKYFKKVTSDNPSRYGAKENIGHSDEKTQPAKANPGSSDGGHRNGNYLGNGHDFNIKGKVTSNEGSDYHDYGRATSGLQGNYKDKDASLEYLRNRNKDGMLVQHFSGTERHAVLKVGGGATAYDPMPIPEVYKSATSQGEVPPHAIQYKNEIKDRNESPTDHIQNTESSKLGSRIVGHIKQK